MNGTHRFSLQERIIYGKPAAEAVAGEVTALGIDRVYVMSALWAAKAGWPHRSQPRSGRVAAAFTPASPRIPRASA